MPTSRFRCPECDALIRLSGPVADGKKVRCPECDARVRPPADDDVPRRRSNRDDHDEDRPRRSRSVGRSKAKASNAPLIIVGTILFTLLLVGGVVGVVLYTQDKNNHDPVIADGGPKGSPQAKGPAAPPPPPPGPIAKAGGGTKRPTPSGVGLEVGQLAPEIENEDIDGETFKLSDYRGKVVMLDFWGHW